LTKHPKLPDENPIWSIVDLALWLVIGGTFYAIVAIPASEATVGVAFDYLFR
jgi:hypothetical protein